MDADEEGLKNGGWACRTCGARYGRQLDACPEDGGVLIPIVVDRLVGTILAERYEILSLVGQGGMSAVYRARHMLMDRTVAIKMLLPHLVANPQSLGRFQQEAKTVSALDHQHIIRVYDFGVSPDGQPYLVMDFIEGKSLITVLEHENHLPIPRAMHIFDQMCEALAHAHEHGVIHRDIKPSNIMLLNIDHDRDFVKIVDFGIAKLLPQDGKEVQQLTQTGEVFGSPLYMSPEQCIGQKPDHRSDMFSVGCVMYETLTGCPPFLGDNVLDTMYKRVSEDPVAFSLIRADVDIPPSLEAIVRKTLSREPADRFASMEELREVLRLYSEGRITEVSRRSEVKTRPPAGDGAGVPPPPVRRAERIALVVLLLVVGFFIAWDAFGLRRSVEGIVVSWQERRWKQLEGAGEELLKSGKLAESAAQLTAAESEARRFGALDKRVVVSLKALREVYQREGKFLEVDDVSEKLAEIRKERLAQEYGESETELTSLVNTTLDGLPSDWTQVAPADSEEAVDKLASLGRFCFEQGDLKHAGTLFDRALSVQAAKFGEDNQRTCWLIGSLAAVYMKEGKPEMAQPLYEKAVAVSERVAGRADPYIAVKLNHLGRAYTESGDLERAEACHKRAAGIVESSDGAHPATAVCLRDYARLLRRRNRHEEALAVESILARRGAQSAGKR